MLVSIDLKKKFSRKIIFFDFLVPWRAPVILYILSGRGKVCKTHQKCITFYTFWKSRLTDFSQIFTICQKWWKTMTVKAADKNFHFLTIKSGFKVSHGELPCETYLTNFFFFFFFFLSHGDSHGSKIFEIFFFFFSSWGPWRVSRWDFF
jgi:hypothetical protein